jgi:hypothetical protein
MASKRVQRTREPEKPWYARLSIPQWLLLAIVMIPGAVVTVSSLLRIGELDVPRFATTMLVSVWFIALLMSFLSLVWLSYQTVLVLRRPPTNARLRLRELGAIARPHIAILVAGLTAALLGGTLINPALVKPEVLEAVLLTVPGISIGIGLVVGLVASIFK